MTINARSILLGAATALRIGSAAQTTCANPCVVIYEDFPDPSFVKSNGSYYAFGTMSGSGPFVQMATSPDFFHWEVSAEDPFPEKAGWETDELYWAPHVNQREDGKFVLYYTAQVADSLEHHCVGAAVADEASGPYIPLPEPFACDLTVGGAIDASGFVDSDGSRYVLYKVDGNSIGNGGDCGNSIPPLASTPIMLQKVKADGTTPVGEPVPILDRDDSDGPLIEAPSLILRDGVYYLFFSSHCYTSPEYDVRYATSKSLTGPFTKAEGRLLITGDWSLDAPGGATVADDGETIMFHANCAAGRCSFIGELSYDGTSVSVV